ncbi:hypothetical protein DSECCO2_25920 [anaerobic digester metagenome]
MVTLYVVLTIFVIAGLSLIWGSLSGTGWALRIVHNETKKIIDYHMEFMQKIQKEAGKKHIKNNKKRAWQLKL